MKWYGALVLALTFILVSAGTSFASSFVPSFSASIGSQSANSANINFKWTNAVSGGQQVLTRTDKSGVFSKQFVNVPQGNQTYSYTDTAGPTVTSAAGGGTTNTYSYQLATAQGGNTQTDTASVQYFDSNIVTVTTKKAVPTNLGTNTYSLVCAPVTTSSIYVGWTANVQNPATGTVYASPYSSFNVRQSTKIADANGSGSYVVSVPAGSTRYFLITDSGYKSLSNKVGPCSPLSAISNDAPSGLNIFTNGPKSLYLNWKDNSTSTAASVFELQRFQVTPPAATNVTAKKTGNSVTVSWSDPSTASGPFYTLITRKDRVTGATASFTVSSTATSYTDSSVSSGTPYEYSVTNVSWVPANEFYQYPAGTDVTKPNPVSSTPATSGVVVGYDAPHVCDKLP